MGQAIFLHKTDVSHVIKSLEAIFRTDDLPNIVRSDNFLLFRRGSLKDFKNI